MPERCPQSGDYAPANTDPTGSFECSSCGKTLKATPKGWVPKHTRPEDDLLQAIFARKAKVTRSQGEGTDG